MSNVIDISTRLRLKDALDKRLVLICSSRYPDTVLMTQEAYNYYKLNASREERHSGLLWPVYLDPSTASEIASMGDLYPWTPLTLEDIKEALKSDPRGSHGI